jgi:hypothetical protein
MRKMGDTFEVVIAFEATRKIKVNIYNFVQVQ